MESTPSSDGKFIPYRTRIGLFTFSCCYEKGSFERMSIDTIDIRIPASLHSMLGLGIGVIGPAFYISFVKRVPYSLLSLGFYGIEKEV
jgi:hypothetical protein